MIKKLFIVLLLIFALIAGLLFASITLMDHNKAYKEFARALKIDVSSIKTNDITIQKFPSPHLSINRIEQDGKMVVKNVDIYFSFMSLLTLDPQITSIKIGEVDFYLDNKDISLLNHDKFFMDFLRLFWI